MTIRFKAVLLAAAVAAGTVSGLYAPAPVRAQEEDLAAPGDDAAAAGNWGTKFNSADGRTVCVCDGGNKCYPCVKLT